MSLSITPGTNNVGAYINSVDLKNLDQNQYQSLFQQKMNIYIYQIMEKYLILQVVGLVMQP